MILIAVRGAAVARRGAEEDDEPCDRDEWDAFEQYTTDSQDVAGFNELDEEGSCSQKVLRLLVNKDFGGV